MAEKLTSLQQETLELIKAGKVTEINGGTGSWRIHGASPNAVGKLLAKKLIKKEKIEEKVFLFKPISP